MSDTTPDTPITLTPLTPDETRDAAPVDDVMKLASTLMPDDNTMPPAVLQATYAVRDEPMIYREIVNGVERTVRIPLQEARIEHFIGYRDYKRQMSAYHQREIERIEQEIAHRMMNRN